MNEFLHLCDALAARHLPVGLLSELRASGNLAAARGFASMSDREVAAVGVAWDRRAAAMRALS